MSLRSRNTNDNISALRQKIAQLHYEKANMRLWKEKDAADAEAEIGKVKAQLNSFRRSLSWQVTKALRQISSFARSVRNSALKHWSLSPQNLDDSEFITQGKEAWDSHAQQVLSDFLGQNRQVVFPAMDCPSVSIVIVSYNSPHLLLLSLLSIADHADASYEVIIVDNASRDDTLSILERVRGATIVRNSTNTGFPAACMQGVSCAVGTFLCFLNNDALLGEGCLSTALKVFAHDASIGAVGAKILDPDGQLQEAGAIIWCDGTTNGYGFKEDPFQFPYLFRRPVDYCSGALLVTPRTLFNDLAGFDVGFSPGYYEDADYCMRLWSHARSVVYEPECIVHHYGNAGSRHKGEALSLVIRNHEKFYRRWASELLDHYEPYGDNLGRARFAAADNRMRILAVVEEIPHRDEGKPSREWTGLHRLMERGLVTCAATGKRPLESDYLEIDRDIELLDATAESASVIRSVAGDYDLFWLPSESSLAAFSSAVCELNQLVAEVELELSSDVRRFAFDEFLATFGKRNVPPPTSP